jgi:hypothetical protein
MNFECEDEGSFGEVLARSRTQTRTSREKLTVCLKVHTKRVGNRRASWNRVFHRLFLPRHIWYTSIETVSIGLL